MAQSIRASADRYPMRQPVIANVFEKPDMVIVRSAGTPGRDAALTWCAPPKTKYS